MDRTQSQWLIDKREAVAEHGMVTAMHPLATAAGLEILRAGGNAVDAAVATAFAIGVVEPAMSGLGGVAAMVIHSQSSGRDVVIDGSSVAPASARADTFELAPAGSVGGMYSWRGTVGDAQNTGSQNIRSAHATPANAPATWAPHMQAHRAMPARPATHPRA